MIILDGTKLDYDDVLLVPQRSTVDSRKNVSLERLFKFYHSPREWTGVPIMVANMPLCGNFTIAELATKHKFITVLHKYLTVDEIAKGFLSEPDNCDGFYNHSIGRVWVSIGMSDDDLYKLNKISYILGTRPNIVIDVPNGHIEKFVKFCAKVRDISPNPIIAAGNVCIPSMCQELIIHGGVDIIKGNVGPGAMCKTREVTGCGYPSLSCTIECSSVCHGLKSSEKRIGLYCADGGLKNPGDFCKAFGGGADFCMAGSYWIGCTETPGMKDGVVKSYGLSTHYSQNLHGEGKKKYRASEGRVVEVKDKGSFDDIASELLGGIRSAAAYMGATSIKDMSKCAVFARVNSIHQNFGKDNSIK